MGGTAAESSDLTIGHGTDDDVAVHKVDRQRSSAGADVTNGSVDSARSSRLANTTLHYGQAQKSEVHEALQHQHNLVSGYTFLNFVEGKSNQLALAAANQVAENPGDAYNPLFLYGGVGLGKTHLMHAVFNALMANKPGARIVYLHSERFVADMVKALQLNAIADFKRYYRSVDALLIDDIQFFAKKDRSQEEFFHTFNALVDQNKQIIISADRAPGEIKDLEERKKSRLSSGLIVDLHPTDFELRLGILQSKVQQYADEYPGIEIADGVLEFLAHRITQNVRVLEGALTRLFAFASLVGRDVDLDLAQDCLADILSSQERKVTVDEIQRKVSEHFTIRLSDMLGPRSDHQ